MEKFEEEIIRYTELNPAEVQKLWFEKLKLNLSHVINNLKEGPGVRHGWYIPDDPMKIFQIYFSHLKNQVKKEFCLDPNLLDSELDDLSLNDRRIGQILYPIIYKGDKIPEFLRLPDPSVPEDFILTFVAKQNSILGFETSDNQKMNNPSDQKKKISTAMDSSTNRKTAPDPQISLKELFIKKYEDQKEYDKLKNFLYKKGLISEDYTTWTGIDMHGKIHLVSMVKYIGLKFLQKSLHEKQVIQICIQDFNVEVSLGSVKKGKSEDGEYLFVKDYPF
ncbi:hypothetical protein [Algoriphagus taiwanensis]|uniref:Uncharacterized protein n=1 Tax=Algoriphagus taiwanensis TaxID=1445656 RepID=A0ABQ6PXM3_9BACT|nr:hypothetical protein Ataiwa_02300 [Algoriphagus taiwanensis]